MTTTTDFLIIGAGIIGLTIARELAGKYPGAGIIVLEKESAVSNHSSGRNSGVLHAGFYYTADSLKARFTVHGNREMKAFCREKGLKLNECGKVVIAKYEDEIELLHELLSRGTRNGVNLRLIDEQELGEIEPRARTVANALYSPDTATIDPVEICAALVKELVDRGVVFRLNEGFKTHLGNNMVRTESGETIDAGMVFNCAGLYADRVAREFGFSHKYTILPFKGIYLKYSGADPPLKTNIYPVPNLKNPFLGVHFTVTVDNHVKIGPTAIPAFWRENYRGLERFSLAEFINIALLESSLMLNNDFGFRQLAIEEIKKYWKPAFKRLAAELVRDVDLAGFTEWSIPGIRAQLFDKQTRALVQDFVLEGDENSVHILNAVSPAFTCSIPFARYVCQVMLSGNPQVNGETQQVGSL